MLGVAPGLKTSLLAQVMCFDMSFGQNLRRRYRAMLPCSTGRTVVVMVLRQETHHLLHEIMSHFGRHQYVNMNALFAASHILPLPCTKCLSPWYGFVDNI